MKNIDITPLTEMGLTGLEAEIYAFLAENSPASGYTVAKGIGRHAANTYKALESLQNKGIIIIEDSKTRLCRAIPPDELLDTFQKRFDGIKDTAARELKKLKASPGDERVYSLQTTEQVISRYRSMLAKCKRVVMLDFFPYAVKELRKDIIAAAKRGVKITVKAYQNHNLPGIKVIVDPDGVKMIKKWPGQWANGVFDAEEYLLAYLSKDGRQVIQSIWSNNHYLSWAYYQGIVHELMFCAIEKAFEKGTDVKKLKRIFMHYKRLTDLKAAGYKNAATFFLENSK